MKEQIEGVLGRLLELLKLHLNLRKRQHYLEMFSQLCVTEMGRGRWGE